MQFQIPTAWGSLWEKFKIDKSFFCCVTVFTATVLLLPLIEISEEFEKNQTYIEQNKKWKNFLRFFILFYRIKNIHRTKFKDEKDPSSQSEVFFGKRSSHEPLRQSSTLQVNKLDKDFFWEIFGEKVLNLNLNLLCEIFCELNIILQK